MTSKLARGVMHGKTIELSEDLGLAEGQEVEVRVEVVCIREEWGAGLHRCAGAFSADWSEDDDRILAEIDQERRASRGIAQDRREATT